MPRTRNLPVPAYSRAPASHRWLWQIGPPAVLTAAYRAIPPGLRRRLWNPAGNASSHLALAAILAGGGWRAFWSYSLPFRLRDLIATAEHRVIADPNMWWLPQPGGSLIRPVPPESRW